MSISKRAAARLLLDTKGTNVMTSIAAAIAGVLAGLFIPQWWGLVAFAIGAGAFNGLLTARRGAEWRPHQPSDDPAQREIQEEIAEREHQVFGRVHQFSRTELFAFELIWTGVICFALAALVRFIVA